MFNQQGVMELIDQLRQRCKTKRICAVEAIECLKASIGEDEKEPSYEIAKTIVELLKHEQDGVILCMTCDKPFGDCEHTDTRNLG